MRLPPFLACVALVALSSAAFAGTPAFAVVAAENFYGDIAKQVGGEDVAVTSILSNPEQDPHLFETSPSVARAVASARMIISNGMEYDPWMDHLIEASRSARRVDINVASLVGRKAGENPHIWYQPETMLILARALCSSYQAIDAAHAAGYAQRLARFEASMVPVKARTVALRPRLAGLQVAATEPVFGYMIAALGMVSRDQGFQLAVMNGTEVSASQVEGFENDLKTRRVRLLIFNRQARDEVADHMKAIAMQSGVPVVGASETEPVGVTYQTWIMNEMDAISKAASAGSE